jgi:hypothetical protein
MLEKQEKYAGKNAQKLNMFFVKFVHTYSEKHDTIIHVKTPQYII